MTGRVESINVSRGGVPKTSVFEALVTAGGVDGDRQAHPTFHGGPERAVVLYSLELIRQLQAEGHPIAPGSTGENFTVSGVDWAVVQPGVEITIAGVRLRVTKFATPCSTIRHSFAGGRFERIHHAQHPGWSRACARVLDEGLVRCGDAVAIATIQEPV